MNESSELAAPHGLWAGACACFAIPFGLGTACGIAARAWGLDVTAGDVVIGLVAPGAAQEYGGRFGAWMFLCLTVAGVSVSAVSQLEALSLLFSHDVYSRYMNQYAKQEELDKIADLCSEACDEDDDGARALDQDEKARLADLIERITGERPDGEDFEAFAIPTDKLLPTELEGIFGKAMEEMEDVDEGEEIAGLFESIAVCLRNVLQYRHGIKVQ